MAFGSRCKRGYGVSDLKFHSDMYKSNAMAAIATSESLMTDSRFALLARHGGLRVRLSKAKWTYMANYISWMDREFIPKFTAFSPSATEGERRDLELPSSGSSADPMAFLSSLREAMEGHSEKVSEMVGHFLCDIDTKFDSGASLGGECSPSEIARWYVGGKQIVEANMDRINAVISDVISAAESQNGRKP